MSSDIKKGYPQGVDLDAIDAAPTYPTKGSEKYYASGGSSSTCDDCECLTAKRIVVVIAIILVIVFAIGLGVGLGKKDSGYTGAFAKTYGDSCSFRCQPTGYTRKPLLVIALDGLRYDYVNRTNHAPNIKRLAQCGVQAKLRPSFPALTYPNLYSIITGLYPDYHGIVSDYIYDEEERNEFEPVTSPEDIELSKGYWYKGKALWESATELGYITASHSWLGSNVEDNMYEDGIQRVRHPTYYAEYEDIDYSKRMNTVRAWIKAPSDKRPRLITMFMEDPGKTAKKYGIYSKQFNESLRETDEAIGILMEDLMEEQMLDCIDVMVVGTSGMIDVTCNDVFYLDDFVDDVRDYDVSPDYIGSFAELMPNDRAKYNTTENLAERLQCQEDFASFYMTNLTIPVRYHYGSNERSAPLVVVMENGTVFAGGQKTRYNRDNCKGANDGFDPYNMSMHGLFVGFGPSFRNGLIMREPVANVELYNLMAELIGVTPEPNNGTYGRMRTVMEVPGSYDPPTYRSNVQNTTSVMFPTTDNEGLRRYNAYESGCSCPPTALQRYTQTNLDGKDYDNNLNLNQGAMSSSRQVNAPYGLPVLVNDTNPFGEDFGYLYQNKFISAYDNYIHIQRMATFNIQKNLAFITPIEDCTTDDVRIQTENSVKCSAYLGQQYEDGLTKRFLFSCSKFTGGSTTVPDFAPQINCLISSNIVPMYSRFYTGFWSKLVTETMQWANVFNGINVVVGPIFDTNHDSRRDTYFELAGGTNWIGDTPVPTHYYYIATRCRGNRQPTSCARNLEDMDILSLVLPHSNEYVPNCKDFEENLANNRATISDIEQLTGIVFFPDLTNDASTAEDMMLRKLLFPSMWSTRN
ncbi:venom phosphodiesterase 2-like isoform X2 [Anneissia japonica]|uniref:venom phosphodiesterase 2-like isoform X2 n=1 Tax=Anneissia japonica TaxID=1529436 RepID=UPI0014256F51|nr:venom phosphodiesterase 2-like isoform X2 [Anneissia japonica]